MIIQVALGVVLGVIALNVVGWLIEWFQENF